MLQFRGYAAKLRRCSAPKVMEFDYLMRRVSVVASMNVKSVLEINVPQCLTTDAAVKVDFHSEVTKGSAKVQLLGQMKLLQSQNKHGEVLQLLSSAKKDNIALINNEIISLSVVSASAVKQPHTVVALIDLGQSQGVRIRPELALAYIKSCKMCASDSQPGMWSKAVGMLETILVADMKESGRTSVGRKLKSSDLIAQCFEEAALLCASSRKWRNVLDIIEKCAETNHPLTERMLSAAIVCCAREINGIENAHNLFRYMAKEEIRRSTKVYTALLQGFLKAGMLDKYEAVWAQMKAENLPCTDVLYATRIEAYAAASETEKAELTLKESLQSIKRPKVSYNALYLTLLKAGSTQKALNLVKMMREAGVQPPEQHSASFHVQSLSKLGLIEEGLRFLRSEEEGYYTQIATAKEVADTSTNSNEAISLSTSEDEDFRCVNDAAWQALFKGSLVHGNFRVSEELLDLVIEKYQIGKWRSSDSSPSPADSNLWLSQLCRAMGKAGQWREALSIADRQVLTPHVALQCRHVYF